MSGLTGILLVSEAAEFAANRHAGERRKARPAEPYVNHLAEVANLLAKATQGSDAELIAAGWLHDTVEDDKATLQELEDLFGGRVAGLVDEVTDDMTLPQPERRRRQVADALAKSPAAKLIKIADKISNVRARIFRGPSDAQRADLEDYAAWAVEVVAGCRGGNAMLDRTFDDAVRDARAAL